MFENQGAAFALCARWLAENKLRALSKPLGFLEFVFNSHRKGFVSVWRILQIKAGSVRYPSSSHRFGIPCGMKCEHGFEMLLAVFAECGWCCYGGHWIRSRNQ